MTELFGLELNGAVEPDDIASAVVVIVEMIDAEDSRSYLKLLSNDLPIWRRMGMLAAVLAVDGRDVADAFTGDDYS